MNQAKAKKLLRDQSPLALTVYAAIPVSEAWSRAMIAGELDRGGHTASMKAIEGCLYSLVDDGLAKEPKKGFFIRTRVSIKAPELKQPTLKLATKLDEPYTIEPEENPVTTDPVDDFDQLKKTLTGIAASLTETLLTIDRAKGMADDIALKCLEAQEGNNEELAKLRALANAMKALQS